MKRSFFKAAIVSILLYGCTIWTLTKRLEKKLHGNYTRMLRAILNKTWKQHPTKQQLYGHLPPITKTIQIRRTRHAGHCWRSSDELISDVLLWTLAHGRAKAGRPAWTYIQQLCVDTGCSPEDLPNAINDNEGWRESVRDIRAGCTTRWWWWWWWYSHDMISYILMIWYLIFLWYDILYSHYMISYILMIWYLIFLWYDILYSYDMISYILMIWYLIFSLYDILYSHDMISYILMIWYLIFLYNCPY